MPVPLSNTEYRKRVREIHGGAVIPLETYQGSLKYIKHRCKLCKNEWSISPNSIMSGRGCSPCKRGGRTTHAEFAEKLHASHEGKITTKDTYRQSHVKMEFSCRCGHRWSAAPRNLISIRYNGRPTGCPECAIQRAATSGYLRKEYKLGKRSILVQGYEGLALDFILANMSIKPTDILVTHVDKVPTIEYYFNGKARRHYPDFYVPKQKRLVEIKSNWTFGLRSRAIYNNVRAKALAAIEQGYKYTLIVMLPNGKRLTIPKAWYELSYSKLLAQIDQQP